jgi:hypothetical protein
MAQSPYIPKAQEARHKAVVERYFHVQFRMRDGKIAEEWVMRDELGMLIQLGTISVGS